MVLNATSFFPSFSLLLLAWTNQVCVCMPCMHACIHTCVLVPAVVCYLLTVLVCLGVSQFDKMKGKQAMIDDKESVSCFVLVVVSQDFPTRRSNCCSQTFKVLWDGTRKETDEQEGY